MSSNQIGGFYNRLEASRKHLFGSVGVLVEPNVCVFSSVFITRVTTLSFRWIPPHWGELRVQEARPCERFGQEVL